MKIVIGFTGTQKGCTPEQYAMLQEQMISASRVGGSNVEVHHGDCIGADLQAHILAFQMDHIIVIHPPDDPSKRAFANSGIYRSPSCIVLPPKPYLERNQDIVDACDVLLACPDQMHERQRSGTWATVRRAWRAKKAVVLIYPNGFVEREVAA